MRATTDEIVYYDMRAHDIAHQSNRISRIGRYAALYYIYNRARGSYNH